ncbi:MAG TPA: hypothetical protein VMB25_15160 [Bryobacteraceae bacterium]|nr:hypothetical protein [Bryobacteraceae bacterium]
MITGLNPANQQFLASLNNLETQLNTAQEQLTTGLRVNQASDAPQELSDIFETRADLGQQTQYIQSLTNVQDQANTADSSIQSALQLIQQAISIGTQGASSTSSASQLQELALQVQGIEGQVVTISRTQVDGVYIFSGDQPQLPAYQVDTSSPTGVDQLITTQATALVQDPTGVTFQASMTAQELFDNQDASGNPTAQNVFAGLAGLTQALQSGNNSNVETALSNLQTAYDYLNQQQGFYGSVENRISTALDLANKFQLQDQTQLSNLQDADIPTVTVDLTQDTTSLNAAMAAEAQMPRTTLFDYLPIQ